MIGAGGSARAVVVGLIDEGARDIRVVNRTLARAQALAAGLRRPGRRGPVGRAVARAARRRDADQHHQPGHERASRALDLALDILPVSALVSDIIYIPRETPLLAAARARGNPTVNGLGMLIHQARPAFKAWFGIMPEATAELRERIEATT